MATSRTRFLNQLLDVFSNIDGKTMKELPMVQATLYLRNELVTRKGFEYEQANQIVSKMEIKLPRDMFDDGEDKAIVLAILDRMADMIGGFWKIMEPELGSFDLFVNMIEGANLVVEDAD